MNDMHAFSTYTMPDAIANEAFSHRVRGFDEAEVRDYLEQLADEWRVAHRERDELRSEIERLRAENERVRAEAAEAQDEVSPQAVMLFSQAQQVADQLVSEAVTHARDLMTSARNQQREILTQAHAAAEAAALKAAQDGGRDLVSSVTSASGYTSPVPEIEYVRTFARVAQVQLRSVLDALTEEVDRLGEVPDLSTQQHSWVAEQTTRVTGQRSWMVESRTTDHSA